MDSYYALEECQHVGDYGEHNLFRVVAICKTKEEAELLEKKLVSKYGNLYLAEYKYGEDIGSSY